MLDSWIDSEGKIIEVGYMQHNDYASELLIKEMGIGEMVDMLEENNTMPYEILHKRGWVRVKIKKYASIKVEILGGCMDLTKIMRNTKNPAMNAKQMRTANRICKAHDVDFINAINDNRFH